MSTSTEGMETLTEETPEGHTDTSTGFQEQVSLYGRTIPINIETSSDLKKTDKENVNYLSFSITPKVTTLHRTKDAYFRSKRKEEAEEQYCSVSACLTVRVMCLFHQ